MESSHYREGGYQPVRRLTTETKHATKTTEFWAYVVILIGLFISAATVDEVDFGAQEAWLFAVILTVGYMISRGLAKSGSRDPYWHDPNAGDNGDGVAERLKAAAQVLKEGEGDSSGTRAPAGTGTSTQRY